MACVGQKSHLARQRPAAVGFVLVVALLDVIGFGVAVPVMPKLLEEMLHGHVSAAATLYGLLTGLYSLMQFFFAPFLGALSDRFGRRPVILAALAGSALDYLLLAFAPNVGWFFIGRAISGISGASIAAASAYIADVTPASERAKAYGLVGAMFGIGFVLGPLIGGLLGDLHLRLPFFVAALITGANWLYGLIFMPESLPPERRSGFRVEQINPLRSVLTLLSEPGIGNLAGGLFFLYLAQAALNSIWVLYSGYRFGWTRTEVGASLAFVGVMAIVVKTKGVQYLVGRFGERYTLQIGLFVLMFSYLGYGLATEGWQAYLLIFFGSLGGVASPAIFGLMSSAVSPDKQGLLQGAVASLTNLAGIIAPPIATGVFGFFISPLAPARVPGAVLFMAAALVGIALFCVRQGRPKGSTKK